MTHQKFQRWLLTPWLITGLWLTPHWSQETAQAAPPEAALDRPSAQENFAAAAEQLGSLPRDSAWLQTAIQAASVAVQAQEVEQARRWLEQVFRACFEGAAAPQCDALSPELARGFQNAGQPHRAAEVLEKQLDWQPERVDILRELATLYGHLEAWENVALTFDRHLQVSPDDIELWHRLASLRFQLGHVRDALKAYQTIREKQGESAAILRQVGAMQLWLDKELEAIASYERVVALEPTDVDTWQRLAALYGWQDKTAQRVDALETILRLTPHDVESRESLVQALIEVDRLSPAAHHLEILVGLTPNSVDLQVRLARLQEILNRYSAAVATLEQVRRTQPNHFEGTRMLADIYRAQGARRSALALYRELAVYSPSDVELQTLVLDLAVADHPQLTSRYDLQENQLRQERHIASLTFVQNVHPSIQLQGGYRFTHSQGISNANPTRQHRLQSHGGFAGITAQLSPRNVLEAIIGVDVYDAGNPFTSGTLRFQRESPGERYRAMVSISRREETSTIDAIFAESSTWELHTTLEWEPANHWLTSLDGAVGYYHHTTLDTAEGQGNLGGRWSFSTGVRLLEEPLSLELLVVYSGEAFRDSGELIPYFAPSLYQSVGTLLYLEHQPANWFRYVLEVEPRWVFADEALQMVVSARIDVRLHRGHRLQARYERTETLVGQAEVIYNENLIMAAYMGAF